MPEITIIGPFEKLPASAQQLVVACRQAGVPPPVSILVAPTVDNALLEAVASASERLVVFPGETSGLTREHALALLACPSVRRILCDRTPDELPERDDLWSVIKGIYALLPSIRDDASVVTAGPRQGTLIVTGPDEPTGPKFLHIRRGPEAEASWSEWLIALSAVDSPVTALTFDQLTAPSATMALRHARIVLASTRDPAVAATVAARAETCGATFVDWTRRLSPLRTALHGAGAKILSPAEYPHPSLRAALSLIASGAQNQTPSAPDAAVNGIVFLQALAADLDGRVADGTVARLVRANEVVRSSSLEVVGEREALAWRLARGSRSVSAEGSPWDQPDAIYRRFIERRNFSPNFFRHAHQESAGFLGAVTRLCSEHPEVCGSAAIGVIDGICDRSLVGWRTEVVKLGLGLLEQLGTGPAAKSFLPLRGGTLLALGNSSDAARDWELLDDDAQRADLLRVALRHWMPAIEVPTGTRPDATAIALWLERMHELRRRQDSPRLRQLELQGSLYLAGDDACAALFEPARAGLVPAWVWNGCMIHAWMVGRAPVVLPLYQVLRDRPIPSSSGEQFLHAVVRAVYERSAAVGPLLDELARVSAGQFEERMPSKPGAFLQALAFSAIGQASVAAAWTRRALEHDALAEARRPLLDRAAAGPMPFPA